MEDSLKKSLFVEFYGLPGSGKSTLSHIVAERLRREGYTVDEPSYDIDHRHPLPKIIKKLAIGCYWFAFHHKQYFSIWNIVQQNGYKGMEAFKQTVNIILKIRIYNSPKAAEIVMIDQGLIQASVSLSMYGDMKARDNYERLLNLMPNAMAASIFYIEVDEETAMNRMSKRMTNDSRVEKLKGQDSKMAMLSRILMEMESIRNQYCGNGNEYIIVSSNNIMEDADYVHKTILSNSNKRVEA